MKNILVVALFLASLTSCQNAKEKQAQHDTIIAEKAKAELLANIQQEQKEREEKRLELDNQSKLSSVGITSHDGKITIDTNKTKDFFKQIAAKVKNRVENITDDIERGMIKDDNAGVEINESHIHVDLNKTKKFLEGWGEKLKKMVSEFNEISKEFEKETKDK